jgi:drug/metabolite transporter (DMT)-like permease
MQRIGVSLAYPIYNTQVLFAAVGGLLLLQEHLTPLGGLGILLLLSGVAILGTDSRAGNISGPQRKVDLLWPLASGLFFGMSYVFRKMGLNISPDIFLGLPIVASSSFLAVSLPAPITGQRLSILKGSVLAMLLFASALSAVAQFFSIWAIEMGRIVAVIPLQNTSPLFTVALSALFLRKLERVTRRVAAGVVLVVAGGALVNL